MNLDTIPFVQARWFTPRGFKPSLIVIHDMEAGESSTTAENCANYFRTTSVKASCNYSIDNDSVVCSVRPGDEAYHAGVGDINRCSVGIEQAGYARQSRGEWLDYFGQQMIFGQLVPLMRALMDRYGIAATFLDASALKNGSRAGITTHAEVSKAFVPGGHTDPGPNYPIDEVLKALQPQQEEDDDVLKQVLLRDERNGTIYLCTVGIPIAVHVDTPDDVALLKFLGAEDRTYQAASKILDTMAKFKSPVLP